MTSADSHAVVRALGLRTVLPANWAAGLAEVAALGTFVSPPVAGLVLVTGADLRRHSDPEQDLLPLLERLSRQFGTVCWFASDSDGDVHGWAQGFLDALSLARAARSGEMSATLNAGRPVAFTASNGWSEGATAVIGTFDEC